jgi:hypothetical protein
VTPRKNASLKPQLNQIRSWVQEGATDIWIAHQLGSTPASISRFRRQHDLRPGGGEGPVVDATALVTADATQAPEPETPAADGDAAAEQNGAPKRRRGRRGGRGRSKSPAAADGPLELEGVFDHGDEGYGLWLDGAIRDAAVYQRNWAGHAAVIVQVSADEIVIRRADA